MDRVTSCFLEKHSKSGYEAECSSAEQHHRMRSDNHKGTPGNHAVAPVVLSVYPENSIT